MARWTDWYSALLIGLAFLAFGHSASAHDLAIDQVLLSPDLSSGVLRGEVTSDPELTRGKGEEPSRELHRTTKHARRAHALLALLSFNVGVELGQIAVVALLSLLLYLIRQRHPLERHASVVGSALIAACGLFMIFERIAPLG